MKKISKHVLRRSQEEGCVSAWVRMQEGQSLDWSRGKELFQGHCYIWARARELNAFCVEVSEEGLAYLEGLEEVEEVYPVSYE